MINQYQVVFKADIARFKELNKYNHADLARGFLDFMKKQGAENDFLVANTITEISTKGKK